MKNWTTIPGTEVVATLSCWKHYVISHRSDFTVSYRPPNQHHHVGTYPTLEKAKEEAEKHYENLKIPMTLKVGDQFPVKVGNAYLDERCFVWIAIGGDDPNGVYVCNGVTGTLDKYKITVDEVDEAALAEFVKGMDD
jgi:hypothetical protein